VKERTFWKVSDLEANRSGRLQRLFPAPSAKPAEEAEARHFTLLQHSYGSVCFKRGPRTFAYVFAGAVISSSAVPAF
jgi:hypothetical protein